MSDKKYKYTVKKFAKMLTVHPDKRVTFQDTIDIRDLVRLQESDNEFITNPPGDWPHNDVRGIVCVLAWLNAIEAGDFVKTRQYYSHLVEHGNLIDDNQSEGTAEKLIAVKPPFGLLFEFEVPPENVAAWLAATGFPQISHAKENPSEDLAG